MACAPSEDSDQPGHPLSLIRVFTVCMKKAWVLSYSLSAQPRLGSDWADAQADLILHWVHSHFVGFVMRQLKWQYGILFCGIEKIITVECLAIFCMSSNFFFSTIHFKISKIPLMVSDIACGSIFIDFDRANFSSFTKYWAKKVRDNVPIVNLHVM